MQPVAVDAQPVTLDILGDWWDSFLYAGALYLVTIEGDVIVLDWPSMVESLIADETDRLAIELSFRNASFLYSDNWSRLVRDNDVRNLINTKINRVGQMHLEIDGADLSKWASSTYSKVVPPAISDFEIHNRRIYTASDQGLGAASQIALSRGIDRQWDGEVVRLRASNNGLLAVAAGLDGLRQVRLNDERRLEEPREILGGDFTGCSWLRSSIYGSSQTRAAVLAVFTQTRRAAARTGARAVRTFETYVEDSELFDEGQRTSLDQHAIASRALKTANPSAELAPDADDVVDAARQGLDFESNYDSPPVVTTVRRDVSWAGHGLICRANGPAIDIVRYRPDAALLSKRFDATMSMELPGLQHPVDGDVAPFGVIVESDNDLSVVTAEGVHSVGVTPVKWRTFHRAHNYPNQLHVIAEDRLRIVSYLNEDMRTWGRRAGFGMLADDE